MPRIDTATDGPNDAPCGFNVTFGALSATWARLVWLLASIVAALTAVIANGVSCRFCARNWAVTTISLLTALVSVLAAGSGLAACAVAAGAEVAGAALAWANAGAAIARAAHEAVSIRDAR